MKVNGILLNGRKFETIKVDSDAGLAPILNLLGIHELQGYHTFGKGYIALWQEEREEKTSMEITMRAGASSPMFIDSQVIIINEGEDGDLIDIDFKELQSHFNMENSFWALVKNS